MTRTWIRTGKPLSSWVVLVLAVAACGQPAAEEEEPDTPAPPIAAPVAGVLPEGVLPLPAWASWSGRVNEYGWPLLDGYVTAPNGAKVNVGDLNLVAMAECESNVRPPISKEAQEAFDEDDEGHAGGPRAGPFQFAYTADPGNTWGYARDYVDRRPGEPVPVPPTDPYPDPRKAPVAESAVREQLLLLKEERRGPKAAWSYPGYEHSRRCRDALFRLD